MHFTFNGSARKRDYQSLFEIYGNKIPMPKMSLKFRAKETLMPSLLYMVTLALKSGKYSKVILGLEGSENDPGYISLSHCTYETAFIGEGLWSRVNK